MPAAMQQNNQSILYIFFGLIASGKSILAKAWADVHEIPCYNSDIIRKELAGIMPADRSGDSLDHGIYSKEYSERTYDALLQKAEVHLNCNEAVVLDATYASREKRMKARDLAARYSVPMVFVLCQCSEAETRRRLEKRAKDPQAVSDGNWETYQTMKQRFEPPDELSQAECIFMSTEAAPEELVDILQEKLKKSVVDE
ncbi:MAG: ATP-binding protein [Proteobacteria bacterium]|nr:ATP-binding protein [Pseudomonadota bacterium]